MSLKMIDIEEGVHGESVPVIHRAKLHINDIEGHQPNSVPLYVIVQM